MIPKRSTSAVWMVPIYDPALHKLKSEAVEKYGATRDLKYLNMDEKKGLLLETGDLVTMFKVIPLKQEYRHLLEVPSVATMRKIFRAHVVQALNVDDFSIEDGLVSDEFCESIGERFISTVSDFIIELTTGGNGRDVPFSLPAGYLRERARSRDLRAIFAQTEDASKTENGSE